MGAHPVHQKQQSVFAHEGLEKGIHRQEDSPGSATILILGLPKHSSLAKESPGGNASSHEKQPIGFQRAGILLNTPGACRPMSPEQSTILLLQHPVEVSVKDTVIKQRMLSIRMKSSWPSAQRALQQTRASPQLLRLLAMYTRVFAHAFPFPALRGSLAV